MLTDREFYDSLSEDFKEDIRSVISGEKTLMEVAKKHGLTYRKRGEEFAMASMANMIKAVKKFEN